MFTVYTKETLGDLIKKLKDRADNTNDDIEKSVKNILADVKARGDKALFEYSEKFDKVALNSLRMSESEKEEAIAKVPAELKATIDGEDYDVTYIDDPMKLHYHLEIFLKKVGD